MMWRSRGLVLALALVGCAPEQTVEPVAFGEVCGVDGPFRLLALAPDEVLGGLSVVDGQLYYSIGQRTDGDEEPRYELSSSGLCGEDPRPITGDIRWVFTIDLWPDVLLGCGGATSDVVSLDPTGEQPPNLVFPGGCDLLSFGDPPISPHGLISREGEREGPATLRLYPYPADPRTETSEPVVLLDPVLTPEYPISGSSQYTMIDGVVYVLTSDGELVGVTLPDGAVTVEQADVLSFAISSDARYLLYQDLAPSNGDHARPEGTIFLRDRTTGFAVSLAQGALYNGTPPLQWYDHGIVVLTLPNAVMRVYSLPGLDFVDLPRGLTLRGPLSDGLWLLEERSYYSEGNSLFVMDPQVPESLTLLFRNGNVIKSEPDGLIVLETPPCCGDTYLTDEGKLWFAPFDGRTPTRLAERASNFSWIRADGRLVTTVDLDDEGLGELLLVDLDDGSEQSIDVSVVRNAFPYAPGQDDDLLSYLVVDGERSGLWLARLPAAK